MNRTLLGLSAVSVPLILVLGIAAVVVGSGTLTPAQAATCQPAPPAIDASTDAAMTADQLSEAQLGNARIIYTVAAHRGLPHRAGIIAIATALQESRLHNLTVAVDHDSLGLFQQRPSQGWGTPAQILDPVYAANAFYNRLIRVPDWQTIPVAQAAQSVQRSAYPEAYAKWVVLATELADLGASALGRPPAASCDVPSATGWVKPVAAPVGSGFRTAGRPGHDGVDLITSKGTPIVAAAAGTVSVVKCNISPADWGCNRDGHPQQVRGCGWYVDITHPGAIITRYCHMLTRPAVTVGQHVEAGQPIGLVGSSGHSSGPHLHYEVHQGDHSETSAINPVPFMNKMGAPLGP